MIKVRSGYDADVRGSRSQTKDDIVNILHISAYGYPAFGFGGPVRTTLAMMKGLAALGHNVTVLTTNTSPEGPLGSLPLHEAVRFDGLDIRFFYTKTIPSFIPFHAPKIMKMALELVPRSDMVLTTSFMTYPQYCARRACSRFQIPLFPLIHNGLSSGAWQQRRFLSKLYMSLVERRILNSVSALIYSSEGEQVDSSFHGLLAPSVVVPFAIDTDEFVNLPERGRLRAKLGIPSQAKVILFCGRLTPWKGVDIGLHAFGLLAQKYPELYFLVVGPDGGHQTELESTRAKLPNKERVIFTGMLLDQDRLSAYADADLFILPSLFENFGAVIAEALASGLPCVISDQVSDAPRFVRSGAVKVVQRNPGAFATAIASILDSGYNREVSDLARSFVNSELSSVTCAQRFLEAVNPFL